MPGITGAIFIIAVGVLQTLAVALGAGLGIWAQSTFWKSWKKLRRCVR